jgi:CheY-like chemotaxis protein
MRKATILAVDDKRANLLALEILLGPTYEVLSAGSGEEALTLLRARKDVDLILLDVQMPGMDGFETASRIKQMNGCREIPIIFVTAIYTEDPFIKRGYEVGGIDYFSKPFDPEILKMKVAVYASLRQKAQYLSEREAQVRASEDLLRVGRKLSAVLEALPVGVMIADAQGRICQYTEEVARILGAVAPAESDSYGELLGWWDESKRLINAPSAPLYRALHYGERTHGEAMEIRCVDGTLKTILVGAAPLYSLDRHTVGAVVLVQDVTEARSVERDLAQRVSRFVALGVELQESSMP